MDNDDISPMRAEDQVALDIIRVVVAVIVVVTVIAIAGGLS